MLSPFWALLCSDSTSTNEHKNKFSTLKIEGQHINLTKSEAEMAISLNLPSGADALKAIPVAQKRDGNILQKDAIAETRLWLAYGQGGKKRCVCKK